MAVVAGLAESVLSHGSTDVPTSYYQPAAVGRKKADSLLAVYQPRRVGSRANLSNGDFSHWTTEIVSITCDQRLKSSLPNVNRAED